MVGFFCSTLAIYFIVPIILSAIAVKAELKSDDDCVLKYPPILSIIIAVGIIIANLSIVLAAIEQASGDANVNEIAGTVLLTIIGLFCLFGFGVLLQTINCRVIFNKNELIYRNFLGIKKGYKYSQITKIKILYEKKTGRPKNIKIFVADKRISIEYLMINFFKAERIMKNRLKSVGNSVKIETKNKFTE